MCVWVSLKTERVAARRPGYVVQYREAPCDTRRLNMYGIAYLGPELVHVITADILESKLDYVSNIVSCTIYD